MCVSLKKVVWFARYSTVCMHVCSRRHHAHFLGPPPRARQEQAGGTVSIQLLYTY